MRPHTPSLRSVLLLLILGMPALLAAQEDTLPHDRGHPRAHCSRDCGTGGLREVADRSSHARRSGLWFSAGIGAGNERFDARDGLGWSDGKGGGSGYLKLGGTVNSSLLIGAEAQLWAAANSGQTYDRALGSLMGIAQFYPSPAGGLWLRGGLGWARDNLRTYPSPGVTMSSDINGTAYALGLGYDVPVTRGISITPSLDLVAQDYRTHKERIVNFGIGITLP